MNKQDLDRHITGNYGEDYFKEEKRAKIDAYRAYMGPSGNGMSDRQLRHLAGWTSFGAGWESARAWIDD